MSAVPPTASYRARRLLRRHPAAVGAAIAAAVLVTTLVAGFTWRLAKERDATREQAERAEESLRFEATSEPAQRLVSLVLSAFAALSCFQRVEPANPSRRAGPIGLGSYRAVA